ncbi:MAG: hypothetical protein ACRBN8_12880 [Nannocystales bacterium]
MATGSDPTDDGDVERPEDDDADADDGGTTEPETDGEPEDEAAQYAIRGRTLSTSADISAPQPSAFAGGAHAAMEGECPFDPASEPCNSDACWDDPASPECKDVIETYCTSHPEDPGCSDGLPEPKDGHEPKDGPEPKDEPEPKGGETWACEVDPEWPPCEVCLDPASTDDDCGEAWHQHCLDHPGDEWCDDGGTPEAVYQPTSLSVLVHQVEFSLDGEGCTDPILVGEPDTPHYVDFADAPELVDAVLPPDGTYPCVIITMSDHIQWSVDGENPCAGEHVQDVSGDEDTEEIVRLYLSSAGDSGRDGSDAFEAPGLYLGGALEVGPGIVGSDFVISFPEGVWYRPEREQVCEIQKPEFTFETSYE